MAHITLAQTRATQSIKAEYQGLVTHEINKVLKVSALARHEYDEIYSAAWMGVLEAQNRFDPRKGNDFSAFARQRIRGAIFDVLAQLSPLGRSLIRATKRRLKSVELESFEEQVDLSVDQDQSTMVQLTGQTEVNLNQKAELASVFAPSFLESYKSLYYQALQLWTETLSTTMSLDPAEPHADQAEKSESLWRLSSAFERLSFEEKNLIVAIYDLREVGDNAKDYAKRMGVHRSTISRRHAAVIAKLKKYIKSSSSL